MNKNIHESRKGKIFIRNFKREIMYYKVFFKYINYISKIYGFNTVEFIECNGDNLLKNEVTVCLSIK